MVGRVVVVRLVVGVELVDDDTVVSIVGRVMVIVGSVMITELDVDELDDDELDEEGTEEDDAEEGDELVEADVEVEPAWVWVFPRAAVTRLSKSTRVTSGSSTLLVFGMVLDSSGVVDDGKTSVCVPPPGLITWRAATMNSTASKPSGITLFSIGPTVDLPYVLSTPH